jgi:ABC-2 type transport system ATP-binding protein
VSRKNILCRTSLSRETITAWPEVQELRENSGSFDIATRDAESVLRRLLAADANVRDIEVRRAGLSEAFTEITNANQAGANQGATQREQLQ